MYNNIAFFPDLPSEGRQILLFRSSSFSFNHNYKLQAPDPIRRPKPQLHYW